MPCFQVTLHGRHFSIPIEGGAIARGFLAFRRVIAPDVVLAKKKAEEVLLREEIVRAYIRITEEKVEDARWFIRAEKVRELTWLGRLFWRMPQGFIFYENED